MIELTPEHKAIADEANTRITLLIGGAALSKVEQPIPEIEVQL